MPTYTNPHSLPLIDPNVDLIKDGTEVSALAGDINALANATNTALNGAETTVFNSLLGRLYVKAPLTSADNLDEVTDSGFYPVSNNDAPAGLPEGVTVSGVWVGDLLNSTSNVQVQMLLAYNPARLIIRDRNTAGVWQKWDLMAVDDVDKIDGGAGQRAALVDDAIKARGGIIGTNGLAAVALRFDHHLPEFQAKVLPLLVSLRLPWGQMLNPSQIAAGTESMTYAEIATACYTSGGEPWNHSWSHSDITSKPQADREVTKGLDDLKAGLPLFRIDGWAGPGQPNLMGMEGSEKPSRFFDTYPGRLILAQHAFVRGYYPGIYQPMTGPNLIGAPHSTMDTLDSAYVAGLVSGAVAAGAGLTLMLHSNYLDTPGYMTTAQLTTVLTNIATRRNNGELLVLTPSAILIADARSDYRRNLLTTGDGGLSTSWSETVSDRSLQVQQGVPHELVVTVRAVSAGSVTLNLKETGGSPRFDTTHTASLTAGQFMTFRCLATFPLNTAGVAASLTGDVDHSNIELHAA